MDFWEKLSNFTSNFYVMSVLHKKSRQSLRASPKNSFEWKFSKVVLVLVYSFVKNVPNIHECWLAPVSLRGLTIKGVYEVSYNRYGQIIERVCKTWNESEKLLPQCIFLKSLSIWGFPSSYRVSELIMDFLKMLEMKVNGLINWGLKMFSVHPSYPTSANRFELTRCSKISSYYIT